VGTVYNFDEIIDRSQTDSVKWSANDKIFGRKEVLSMWVADMDFRSPQPVVDALVSRAEHGVYGYPTRSSGYQQAIANWLQKRHGWQTHLAWQVATPGVVPGIAFAVQAFTLPGDKIIVQPPVYYPFARVITNNGRQVVENTLIEENGYYRMDFDALETQLADPRARMLVFCSPHNPVGRVWTRDELLRLGEMCLRHHVLVVSDEIHSDLVFSWAKHIPLAALSPEIAANTITLLAPSKTFNLAGLSTSVAIVSDNELRGRLNQMIENLAVGGGNIFGQLGCEIAYRDGEDWLNQALAYMEGNLACLAETIQTRIPRIKVWKPEATFLAWLDCRGLGLSAKDLHDFMIQQAGLGLNDGITFGATGDGFMRMNIACPRAIIQKALTQLEAAVNALP
jgi:cysteine-S-conjugate beta-lyase